MARVRSAQLASERVSSARFRSAVRQVGKPGKGCRFCSARLHFAYRAALSCRSRSARLGFLGSAQLASALSCAAVLSALLGSAVRMLCCTTCLYLALLGRLGSALLARISVARHGSGWVGSARIRAGQLGSVRFSGSPSRQPEKGCRFCSARLHFACRAALPLFSARLGSLGSAQLESALSCAAVLCFSLICSPHALLNASICSAARPARFQSTLRFSAVQCSAPLGSAPLGSAPLGSARLGLFRLGTPDARLGSAGSAVLCSHLLCSNSALLRSAPRVRYTDGLLIGSMLVLAMLCLLRCAA